MPSGLNQQTAGFTPDQLNAFGGIEGLSGPASGLGGMGSGFLGDLLGGNTASGNLFGSVMGNGGGISNSLKSLGLGGTTGMLADTIGGKYLDPSTNPYLQGTFNEAAKGVTDQYNLATAPSLMAEGEIASGGGPGAFAGNSAANQEQWANQYGLGQNLNNLATNIFGGAYQQERQNQLGAAGEAIGLGEQGGGNQLAAANAAQSGQLSGLGLLPQTQSSLYTPSNELLGIGGMQQQQQQSQLDTLFQNALRSATWPQQMFGNLGSLLNLLGNGTGTQISTSPSTGGMK